MNFRYSRFAGRPRERFLERCFEVLPGLTSWTFLISMTVLSIAKPRIAAVCIIIFDFYWLLRLFYLTLFLSLSYFRLAAEENTDWNFRIKVLDDLIRGRGGDVPGVPANPGIKGALSAWICQKELLRHQIQKNPPPLSGDIFHLVIVPLIKESAEVVEPGIRSYAEGKFPAEQILVVLALEERASTVIREGVRRLKKKFGDTFREFEVVMHPSNLSGEARVKGANVTYAAKQMREYFKNHDIDLGRVIVSCFDADTVVSPNYFACLTYNFMVCPKRYRASFQPIPVYHNNIWEVPGFARVLEIGASFFQLTEATQPEKLVTFSSHSMSFKALDEIGYWPVDMISDDSAIFWKAFLHYDGDYRTVPLYATLSMDVADAGSWWKTTLNIYRQKRRWAWGVENFPIVMRGFMKSKIDFTKKITLGFKLFEIHVAWATWPIILAVVGWLPGHFAGREFENSVLYYTAPRITEIIFNLASVSLVVSIILSYCLLPKRKIKVSLFHKIAHALEWLCIPLVAIFLSAIPALDAQTRLMMGKRMEFWVTDKRRQRPGVRS